MPSPKSPDRTREGDIGVGWYAAALVVYVAAGFFLKSILLNWIVGPLFLLITLYLAPVLVRRLGRRLRAGSAQ